MKFRALGVVCFCALSSMLLACGSERTEERNSLASKSNTDIENGLEAKLVVVTYRATDVEGVEGARCDYDRSWLEVTNLAEPIRTSLNAALNHDPRHAVGACKNSAKFVGGYTKLDANSVGVLSLVYHFDNVQYGATNSESVPTNLDLMTGEVILLDAVLDAAGKQVLVDGCTSQWKQAAESGGDATAAADAHCKDALTLFPGQTTEQFTLSSSGVWVHIEGQVPRYNQKLLPPDGFLVPWSALTPSILAGPAKRLSGM